MEKETLPQQKLDIIEAAPDEALDIFRIQKDTWLATYPNEDVGITPEMIEERFSNMEERVQKWKNNIEGGESKIWIIKSDDTVVGFCGVREGEETNRLASIYVDPQQQGGGIGGRLITQALEYLGRDKDIVLDVASYNANAIDFYQKHGFVVESEVPEEDLLEIGEVKLPETRMVLRKVEEPLNT